MNTPFYSLFGTSTAMTITVNSLANGLTRQSTLVANAFSGQNQYLANGTGTTSVNISTNSHLVRIYFSLTVGTSPTAGGNINFYLIQNDGSTAPTDTTDGCGASDAAYPSTAGYASNTPVNASMIFSITVTATSGQVYKGSFVIPNPGPTWGIAVQNNTGVTMGASGNTINYVTESTQSRF